MDPAIAARVAAVTGGDIPPTAEGAEKENGEGVKMVFKVTERLDGHYNIGWESVPPGRHGWRCSRAQNLTNIASVGMGRRHAASALSIPGQVQRLIREATADENLALMYIGWMPFL